MKQLQRNYENKYILTNIFTNTEGTIIDGDTGMYLFYMIDGKVIYNGNGSIESKVFKNTYDIFSIHIDKDTKEFVVIGHDDEFERFKVSDYKFEIYNRVFKTSLDIKLDKYNVYFRNIQQINQLCSRAHDNGYSTTQILELLSMVFYNNIEFCLIHGRLSIRDNNNLVLLNKKVLSHPANIDILITLQNLGN